MKNLLPIVLISLTGFALSAQSNIQWSKLKVAELNVDPMDSTQSLSGQSQYVLQVALSDTTQVNAFRVNGQNASRQATISNATYELKDQRIYRSTKNNEYVVYIDLGNRPAGNIKDGEVETLDKQGNAISASPKSFSAP